ncbi:MAG: hypothetical protein CMF46_02355 [Legionellales bacterium]|nr:hypothetical protein [Legionellales bacterium]
MRFFLLGIFVSVDNRRSQFNGEVSVRKKVRLSESDCFIKIRGNFSSMSIDDWFSIPHEITNSVTGAQAAVDQVMNLLADILSNRSAWPRDPTICFFDIGCGMGCFAYYFLKQLNAALGRFGSDAPQFCYVLCDVSKDNISFCQRHPKLRPFIENGQLKTFVGSHIELIDCIGDFCSGSDMPFLIGNYLLDVLPQDAYFWKNGAWNEMLFGLRGSSSTDLTPAGVARGLSQRALEFPVYPESTMDELLQAVVTEPKLYERFLWPVSAMDFLRVLSERFEFFAFLFSDYGFSDPEENRMLDESFTITNDGAFCYFPVQFSYLKRYVEKLGGTMVIPGDHESLIHSGGYYSRKQLSMPFFLSGLSSYSENSLVSRQLAIARTTDFNAVKGGSSATLSMLGLVGCDPAVYFRLIPSSVDFYNGLSQYQKHIFSVKLYKVVDHFYGLGSRDLGKYVKLVESLIVIRAYEQATELIEEGLHRYDRSEELMFLKGRVLFLTECFLDSIEWFDRCIQLGCRVQEAGALRERSMDYVCQSGGDTS